MFGPRERGYLESGDLVGWESYCASHISSRARIERGRLMDDLDRRDGAHRELDEQLLSLKERLGPTLEYYEGFLEEGELSQNSALAGWVAFMREARTVKAFERAWREFLKVGGVYVERSQHEVRSLSLVGEVDSSADAIWRRLRGSVDLEPPSEGVVGGEPSRGDES